MSNPIFIDLKTGEDETEWNQIIDQAQQLFEKAVFKESTDLVKDGRYIGRLDIGVVAHNEKEVSGFIFAVAEYAPEGKALWFETTDPYYRFDRPIGRDTIESWILLVLYSKLRGAKNPFHQMLKREFFPTWDEDHNRNEDHMVGVMGSTYTATADEEQWQP